MVTKAKPASRKEKALETRKKIYECAERLFKNHGFEQVSVDAIVEAAGVSKGAFYVHFDSKDALIISLAADYVKKLDLDYKSHLESLPANAMVSDIIISLAKKIADVIVFVIGYDVIKAIYQAQITKSINTDSIMSYNRELYKIFTDLINQGIEKGEFHSELPTDTIAKHFIMTLRGMTYEWCIRYPNFNLKEQFVITFEMLLRGLNRL